MQKSNARANIHSLEFIGRLLTDKKAHAFFKRHGRKQDRAQARDEMVHMDHMAELAEHRRDLKAGIKPILKLVPAMPVPGVSMEDAKTRRRRLLVGENGQVLASCARLAA